MRGWTNWYRPASDAASVAVEDVVRIAQMIAGREIDHDEAYELLDLFSEDDE